MKKFFLPLIMAAVLSFSGQAFSQQEFGIGAYLGGGAIQGSFPSQGSFTSTVFADFSLPFAQGLLTRASFLYITGINILQPQVGNRYNPTLRGFSLKEVLIKNFEGNIFFEGALGPAVINDRTYSNINTWDTGVAFSALAGIDFRDNKINADGTSLVNGSGLTAGIGTEYGLTFTNTTVNFFSIHLQIKYSF